MSAVTRPTGPVEATRLDATNGTEERISFRGPAGDRVFSCLYLPASTARGCVLICSPMYAEFTRNYRREVLLARKLAADGFAVERFHYRGTGNSDGAGSDVTFETMRDDARTTLEHLRTESGVELVFLVGTRWGAMVASAAASLVPDASLVLWEPLLETARFFRDAFRTRMVAELKSGSDNPTKSDELIRRLEAGRSSTSSVTPSSRHSTHRRSGARSPERWGRPPERSSSSRSVRRRPSGRILLR